MTNQDKTAASLAALQVIAGSAGELAQAVAAKVEHHEGQQRQRQQQQQQQPNMIGSTAGAPAPTGATGVCAAPYADAASDGAYGMSHPSAGGVSPNPAGREGPALYEGSACMLSGAQRGSPDENPWSTGCGQHRSPSAVSGLRPEQSPGSPPVAFGSDFAASFGLPAGPSFGLPAYQQQPMTFDMSRGDRTLPNGCGGSAAPGKPMFEEMIAQSTQMTYSDEDTKKAQCAQTVRNYLIVRGWEMRQLLLWAESFQKQVITFTDIQNLGMANTYMEDIGVSPWVPAVSCGPFST